MYDVCRLCANAVLLYLGDLNTIGLLVRVQSWNQFLCIEMNIVSLVSLEGP